MSRTALRCLLVLVPLAALCGGCLAVGQSFDLAAVLLTLAASGAGSIAIGAVDRRELIRSGARQPTFAGTLRGGFGNPFEVKIRGDLPLAHLTADVIAKGLAAKGFQASAVKIDPKADEAAVLAGLKAAGADKLLLVDIEKWHSDTYLQVGMHYALTAKVLDRAGAVLAEASVAGADGGKDNLKGSVMNPAGYAKKAVPKAFRDQLERLLNADAVVKALS
jgi:hypothetical protein